MRRRSLTSTPGSAVNRARYLRVTLDGAGRASVSQYSSNHGGRPQVCRNEWGDTPAMFDLVEEPLNVARHSPLIVVIAAVTSESLIGRDGSPPM
jgi:hypothetical protein